MNKVGAFTSILSAVSAGCTGKERHMLWYTDGSWCPWCTEGSMGNKGFSIVTSRIPSTLHVKVQIFKNFYGAILDSRMAV